MKDVSTKWQQEIKNPNRNVSVSGTFFIKSGDELVAHHIPEDAIIANSLTITDQLNTGKFSFGSVYLKNLSVKIDYTRCNDLDAKNINLTNAQIRFSFTLHYDDGTSETLNLEHFLVDSTRSSRRGDILSIYGVSCMSKLDITAVEMTDATPYEIYRKACSLANIHALTTATEFSTFPNADKTFTFDTKQIKTARDMLMWVAELTCTNAIATVDYSGGLNMWAIKLVQIPAKYTQGGTPNNFDLNAFKADNGTIIPADIRYKSEFTDTSIRTTTISAQNQGTTITEHRKWTFLPDTLEGSMEIDFNPLLDDKRSDETALQEWIFNTQRYVEQLRFCPFKVKFLGNPAIEVGDFVYLEAGGDIDETDFRHYGIVTYSKWTYPDSHEIRCATDLTAERPESASAIATMSMKDPNEVTRTVSAAPYAGVSEIFGVKPKSQLEKKVDALSGGGASDRIVNGNQTLMISPGAAHSEDCDDGTAQVSIKNGILQIASKYFYANLYGGNTYIETTNSYGRRYKVYFDVDGFRYEADNSDGVKRTFYISFTSSYGGGIDIKVSQSNSYAMPTLTVANQGLYFNGRAVAFQ